jgi:hypothetical protein
MSEARTPAQAEQRKRLGLDKWGLKPVPRGFLRGRVTNMVQSEAIDIYGQVQVIAFDLVSDEDTPPVPVRMTATDYSHRLTEGHLVDVPDPPPHVRPVAPEYLMFSVDVGGDDKQVTAYYPGRGMPSRRSSFLWALLVIAGPIVFVLLATALISWYFNIFR